jgi:Acetyltransferase (GNAT) family
MTNHIEISKAEPIAGQLAGLPRGISLFEPLFSHEVKEALESGGEAFISEDSGGHKDGLFIYDSYEATGTIFTKSREAFDHLFRMKPASYIFSELDVPELPKEFWNIWQLEVDKVPSGHRFRHHVSMDYDVKEIREFMTRTQPETNPAWIDVALKNGDKCFVVKISGRIVGMAWMTMAGGIARSHGLFVEPQFRRLGIMRDNLHARLIYLRSRHVHTLINEIAETNVESSGHAARAGEKIAGKIYLYTTPEKEETIR